MKYMLALLMIVVLAAAFILPGMANAVGEEKLPYAIGSTHINADPREFGITPNPLNPLSAQWNPFGVEASVPIIIAFAPDDIGNVDANLFSLSILTVDNDGNILSETPANVDTVSLAFLQSNELALGSLNIGGGGDYFLANTLYKLTYTVGSYSITFKTKAHGGGGGGGAMVFNLGGIPWDTEYSAPSSMYFLYSFSNNIPEEVYDRSQNPPVFVQNNSDSIFVFRDGVELEQETDYTLEFQYEGFLWLLAIVPDGDAWVAGEYIVVIVGLDLDPALAEALDIEADPLKANNNNPLNNSVVQIFDVY